MSARNQTVAKRTPKTALASGVKRLAATNGKVSKSSAGKASSALDGTKRLTVVIGREAAANFRAWFERNFANPRAGRIGTLSYPRAGALDDRPGDSVWYSDAYGRAFWDHIEPLTPDEEDYLRSHPLVLLQLALGVTDLRGLRSLRRGLTLRTNALQQKSYRSRYYARDNARRRQLAAERRKISRRTTTNPCPTPDKFRAAFARVRESAEAKVLFGGMVHDLACYVDSCLRYDKSGNIVGRNGVIRAWIAENAPELSPRYKTIMRYKALAMRVRQLAGLKDPQPTSVLLDGPADGRDKKSGEPDGNPSGTYARARENRAENRSGTRKAKVLTELKNYSAYDSHFWKSRSGGAEGDGQKQEKDGAYELVRGRDRMVREPNRLERETNRLERKRRHLQHVLAECRNTFKDVFDRIDSELG